MFLSAVEKFTPSWIERFGAAVLKQGPIPKHIAIILDGNRRYARKKNLENVTAGHLAGANKIGEAIGMLLLLGVEELTVYAFSTENFKRSVEEVNGIFEIMEEESSSFRKWKEFADQRGICIEIVGNSSRNPSKDLQKYLERNMILTKENKRLKFNLAFVYTGRDEICRGINEFLDGVPHENIEVEDLTESVLPEFFYLHPSRTDVDILIRTNGECRFSDFMIWQCAHAHLEFVQATWPEFAFWELLKILLRYQLHCKRASATEDGMNHLDSAELDIKMKKYVQKKRDEKWKRMKLAHERIKIDLNI